MISLIHRLTKPLLERCRQFIRRANDLHPIPASGIEVSGEPGDDRPCISYGNGRGGWRTAEGRIPLDDENRPF